MVEGLIQEEKNLQNDKEKFQQHLDSMILQACRHGGTSTLKAVHYHLSSGGGRTRALMAYGTCVALGISHKDSLHCAGAVESLHNASLIHDDLQDKDAFRRDLPSLWSVFDKNTAVSVGDLMISASYDLLTDLSTPHLPLVLKTLHQRLSQTVRGQQQDLALTPKDSLSLDEYLEIATNKSAPLFSLALEIAFLYKNMPDMAKYSSEAAYHFALAYQLFDDYCDRVQDLESGEKNAYNLLESIVQKEAREALYQLITENLEESEKLSSKLPLKTPKVLLDCINKLKKQVAKVF